MAQLKCFHSCLCNEDVSADQPWAGKSQFPDSKQQPCDAETEVVPIQNAQVLEGLLGTCHSDNDTPLWADDPPTLDYYISVRRSTLLLPCSSLKCHLNPTPSVF